MTNGRLLAVLIFFTGVLVGVLVDAAWLRPGAEKGSPTGNPYIVSRLVVEESTYDFGVVPKEGIVSHTFLLRNASSVPVVVLSVHPACSCTTAELASPTIAPGETTELIATLDVSDLSGPQSRFITLQTNDPNVPAIRLTMVGEVQVTQANGS